MTSPTEQPIRLAAQSGMKFPMTLWSRLPSPADYVGMAYYVSDTPVGPSLVVSDGKMWRIFARNIFSGRITLKVTDAGAAKFEYGATTYSMLPTLVVTLGDSAKLGRLSFFVESESLTGCTIRVQRGQALPMLTTGLLGFDPFSGGQTTGVTVNLLAIPNS